MPNAVTVVRLALLPVFWWLLFRTGHRAEAAWQAGSACSRSRLSWGGQHPDAGDGSPRTPRDVQGMGNEARGAGGSTRGRHGRCAHTLNVVLIVADDVGGAAVARRHAIDA